MAIIANITPINGEIAIIISLLKNIRPLLKFSTHYVVEQQ
jgi:hypothetical protein